MKVIIIIIAAVIIISIVVAQMRKPVTMSDIYGKPVEMPSFNWRRLSDEEWNTILEMFTSGRVATAWTDGKSTAPTESDVWFIEEIQSRKFSYTTLCNALGRLRSEDFLNSASDEEKRVISKLEEARHAWYN